MINVTTRRLGVHSYMLLLYL